MNEEITRQVQQVFRNVFQEPELLMTEDLTANDIVGWDSLTHMTLISELEHVFSITFTFTEVVGFKNVGDIIRVISGKISG